MEVPEPRTVTFSGVRGMFKWKKRARPGAMRGSFSGAGLGLGLRRGLGLGRDRLADLYIRQLEFSEQVQEQVVFLGRKIAFGKSGEGGAADVFVS